MRVVALKKHRYGGAGYEVGESYEAQDKYAKTLILAKVVKAETDAEPEAEKPPKRRYRRRDMTAEA